MSSKAEIAELACVYAGLILFDDKAEITADKINKILKASGIEVDAYYPEFFAKYLSKADIKQCLLAKPSAPVAAPAEEHKDNKKDDKKGGKKEDKKKKEEKKKEESDDEAGLGDIFG